MKAVISTVQSASVTVTADQLADADPARGTAVGTQPVVVGSVSGPALLVLLGVGAEDSPDAAPTMVRKIAELRLLADPEAEDDRRTLSAVERGAPILLVSQFTLMGATAKGRRPSWSAAAPGEVAARVVEEVAEGLRQRGLHVETGRFGAHMMVSSVNDGPFTVIVDCP